MFWDYFISESKKEKNMVPTIIAFSSIAASCGIFVCLISSFFWYRRKNFTIKASHLQECFLEHQENHYILHEPKCEEDAENLHVKL